MAAKHKNLEMKYHRAVVIPEIFNRESPSGSTDPP
jgi:hypothetical protein